MHYIPFYIGDYDRDTKGLTAEQDGIYFRLLRHVWATGQILPLNLDEIYRIAGAFSETERKAVGFVVERFFQKDANGFRNRKAEETHIRQQAKIEKAKQNGALGGRPKKDQKNLTVNQTLNRTLKRNESYPDPDPIIKEKISKKESFEHPVSHAQPAKPQRVKHRLPEDWRPDQDLLEWAKGKQFGAEMIQIETERFKNHFISKGEKRIDWRRTWQNWMTSPYNTSKSASTPILDNRPKWKRWLEDYQTVATIFETPEREFLSMDLEPVCKKNPDGSTSQVVTTLRHKHTEELLSISDLKGGVKRE